MDPPVSRPSPCSARELQERLVGAARPLHPPLAATCCRPRVPLPFPHNGTESPLYLRRRRPLRRFFPTANQAPFSNLLHSEVPKGITASLWQLLVHPGCQSGAPRGAPPSPSEPAISTSTRCLGESPAFPACRPCSPKASHAHGEDIAG
jgi:hypothetical protein